MEFPVDMLESMSHGELERSAHSYMNELLYMDPDHAHYFTLPSGRKVQISLSSVGFVPLYGANLQHKVLALFTPQDQLTAVALFLANQWYSVEDILKTANSRREGLVKVRSVGDRIVLYMLNRIVYRTNEMGSGEMPFLCHSENDYAKILWKNGQAVGFYSVKPKGSVCNNSLRQCYFLPVMDSIYIRKAHRGKGYGLRMLEDFVDSFNEDELGLKYPLSPAMTNVCRRYLDRYPADVDLFWEVEGVGGPYQRTRVSYKLASRSQNADAHKGGHGEDNGRNGDVLEDEVEESEEACHITEEVTVVNKHHKVADEKDTPISTRTRSSEHRRRKRVRDEAEAKGVDRRPDKMNRMDLAEEEKKEFVPADGVVFESVPEAPTETLEPAVNGKQAEDEEQVKVGAEEEDESAIENSTCGEENEEMEVENEAVEDKAPVQKVVDTPEEATPIAEDNQKMEVDPIANLQQKKEDPAVEEEWVAENEQKEVDTQVAPVPEEKQEVAPTAEEEQEGVPAAEEEQEGVPVAEEEGVSAAEEEQEGVYAAEEEQDGVSAAEEEEEGVPGAEEKEEGAPAAEEEQERAPAAEEEQEEVPAAEEEKVVASTAEEEQEGVPAAEEEKVVASTAEEEKEGALSFGEEQEVAPEIEKNEVDSAAEEEQKVAPDIGKQEVDPPTKKRSSLATDVEGEQGQEEPMDVVNDIDEVPDISEQSSKEEESQASDEKEDSVLMVEEEEAAQKKYEMDEEGEEQNASEASDISRVLRGARTKAVSPTSKRSSKRLSKTTPEAEEEEQDEAKVVEEDKGMSTEEEKVTTEEEAEHSSEEEQVQDPPVIDKRVLRAKTKRIPSTQRTRSKRRGKM